MGRLSRPEAGVRPYLVVDCNIDTRDWLAPYREHLGPRMVVARGTDGAPGSSEGFAGLVLTGSAASVVRPDPWVAPVEDLVRDAIGRGVPVLGICFGHQLIGRAVAGPEAVFTRHEPEVGYPEIEVMAADGVLSGLGPVFRGFATHGDEVRPVPEIEVLARTPACPVHALNVRGRPAWGVQFHLEMSRDEEAWILEYRRDKFPSLRLDPPALLAARPDASQAARTLFANFKARCDAV